MELILYQSLWLPLPNGLQQHQRKWLRGSKSSDHSQRAHIACSSSARQLYIPGACLCLFVCLQAACRRTATFLSHAHMAHEITVFFPPMWTLPVNASSPLPSTSPASAQCCLSAPRSHSVSESPFVSCPLNPPSPPLPSILSVQISLCASLPNLPPVISSAASPTASSSAKP